MEKDTFAKAVAKAVSDAALSDAVEAGVAEVKKYTSTLEGMELIARARLVLKLFVRGAKDDIQVTRKILKRSQQD